MPRKKSSKRKKKKNTNTNHSTLETTQTLHEHADKVVTPTNFVPEAGPGCHIVRFESSLAQNHDCYYADSDADEAYTKHSQSPQILGWDQDFVEEDFEGQAIPDIALDPSEDGTSSTLTLCNVSHVDKVAYITVYTEGLDCFGRHGTKFLPGTTTDNDGHTCSVVTFIVLAPPMTFCTLCDMVVNGKENANIDGRSTGTDITSVRIESDVQEWNRHPDPSLEYKTPLRGFPLESELGSGTGAANGVETETNMEGTSESSEARRMKPISFLCTQGVEGQLTHYFSGNLHAIDFRCDVGTPLLAVEDGEVVEVKDGNTLTGISALNMFRWNSIMIRHRCNMDAQGESSCEEGTSYFFTEYVHIRNATVQEGDKVQRGDRIGFSGSVGFSPEPHLHFALYLSREADAPSVGFWFQGRSRCRDSVDDIETAKNDDHIEQTYRPIAGKRYNAFGLVDVEL